MRRDFRTLADDRDVDGGDIAAFFADEGCGVLQKAVRRGAPPARLARRKVHPDIAGADRSEQRISQRVQADIGVGMADEPGIMRDRDAADHDVIAGAERMHVETLADPDISGSRREQPLGRGEVLCGSHLQIVLASWDHDGRHPGRLGDCGIVGQHLPGSSMMRREDRLEMEPLRGLRPPQLRAVDGFPDHAVGDPFDRVAERQGRDRGGRPIERVEDAVDQRRIGKRPRGVVDQHARRIMPDERFEPEAHRILPLGSARHRRQQGEAGNGGSKNVVILLADHDLHPADPGMCRERRHGMTQHRRAAEREILLGQRAAEPCAAAGRDDQGVGCGH